MDEDSLGLSELQANASGALGSLAMGVGNLLPATSDDDLTIAQAATIESQIGSQVIVLDPKNSDHRNLRLPSLSDRTSEGPARRPQLSQLNSSEGPSLRTRPRDSSEGSRKKVTSEPAVAIITAGRGPARKPSVPPTESEQKDSEGETVGDEAEDEEPGEFLDDWTSLQVADWVGHLGEAYAAYRKVFSSNALDGQMFASGDITPEDLMDLDVKKVHAKVILRKLSAVKTRPLAAVHSA